MTIREYVPEDIPRWVQLRQKLWPDCSADIQSVEMTMITENPQRATVFVLADGDGRLHGFAEVSIRDRVDGAVSDRVGYLEGWYVDPEFRRHGWGKRLVAAAEAWTSAQGLTELASDAELWNEDAHAAHRAVGFRETFRVVQFIKNVR